MNPVLQLSSNKEVRETIVRKINILKQVETDSPTIIIVHSFKDIGVLYMSPNGLKKLGITLNTLIKMGTDYHRLYFNQEYAESYVPKILSLLANNNTDEIVSYVQQVRHAIDGDWIWYMSCSKIFARDENGLPLLLITHAMPLETELFIDPFKAQRLMDENSFLRKNAVYFNTLTKREIEILRLMALGHSSEDIAVQLFLSVKTIKTHRRNIKSKLKADNSYDITRYAQAFGLL